MTRWFILSFVVVCLIGFIQAFPQSGGETAATTAAPNNIGAAFSDVLQSVQRGVKQIMEDPGLSKLAQDGQRFFENAANSIRNEASKIMPQTE